MFFSIELRVAFPHIARPLSDPLLGRMRAAATWSAPPGLLPARAQAPAAPPRPGSVTPASGSTQRLLPLPTSFDVTAGTTRVASPVSAARGAGVAEAQQQIVAAATAALASGTLAFATRCGHAIEKRRSTRHGRGFRTAFLMRRSALQKGGGEATEAVDGADIGSGSSGSAVLTATMRKSQTPARSNEEVDVQTIAIVVLCFLVTTICALDRAAMSVAILPMAAEYGYTDGEKGLIGSAYFWGYTAMNLLTGPLCTIVSPKLLLSLGVVVWSAFTVLTPAAASSSFLALLACRACMGISEGVCLPTIQALLANWVPKEGRSRAVALISSGITAGTIGALFLAPQLVSAFGWPSVFLIFGATGFLWTGLWLPVAEDSKNSKGGAVEYSRELSLVNMDTAKGMWADIPWGQLADSTPFRGVLTCAIAHNTGVFLILAWLPNYFAKTYSLGVAEASMLAAPPWVCCFMLANFAGWAADTLVTQGFRVKDVRRAFQLVGSLVPAVCLAHLGTGVIMSQQEAVLWFTAALGFTGFYNVGCNASSQDMSQRLAPVLYGIMNATGCFFGSCAVWLTGLSLDANPDSGFTTAFAVASGMYVLGAMAFTLTYEGEREFD